MKHNKIALIGMMGSGKSTIAKNLSLKTNIPFYELDEIFEKENNTSIKDYFKKYGEEAFRKKEIEILNKTIKNENFILSTGGGIILKEENRKTLFQDNILTIYLKANKSTLFKRIKNNSNRPLLQVNDPINEIENILKKREKYYKLANCTIIVDNKTIDGVVGEILEIL